MSTENTEQAQEKATRVYELTRAEEFRAQAALLNAAVANRYAGSEDSQKALLDAADAYATAREEAADAFAEWEAA